MRIWILKKQTKRRFNPEEGAPRPKHEDNPDPNKGLNFGGGVKGLKEIDWDGNIVWEYIPGPEEGSLHHDFA